MRKKLIVASFLCTHQILLCPLSKSAKEEECCVRGLGQYRHSIGRVMGTRHNKYVSIESNVGNEVCMRE